jgi:hypothetical protein
MLNAYFKDVYVHMLLRGGNCVKHRISMKTPIFSVCKWDQWEFVGIEVTVFFSSMFIGRKSSIATALPVLMNTIRR